MPDTPLPIERQPPLAAPRPAEPVAAPRPAEPPAAPRRRGRGWLIFLLLLAAGGGAIWWYWPQISARFTTQPAASAPGVRRFGGAVPVTASAALRKDIPVQLDALGTVQALNTITMRSQVDGILIEVAFTEGQEVRRGDVLARIDPRSYAAALAQAEAKRAQNMAVLANSRLDLERYIGLVRSNGASRQQLDTQRALVAQNEALVQADEAAIAAARIQLDFTTIRSPIDGRVGLRQVDQGNIVRSGDANGLVVVSQVDSVSVLFTLPQQELPRIMRAMNAGPVAVQVLASDGAVRATGTVLTPDNAVDPTTGTIRLKATFPNSDRQLWPGAFVNVRMLVDTLRDVLAIPLVAVQRGPQGPFAFVVKADNTVEQRPITLGLLTATDAVVTRGLEPEERVVTSGGLRLSAGSQVSVTEPVVPPAGEPRRRRMGGPPAATPPAAAP